MSAPSTITLPFSFDRLRHTKLEDGEPVVLLRDSRKRRPERRWPSDSSHAGVWSRDLSYAFLGSVSRPGRRAAILRAFDPCLEVIEADDELLVRGPHETIQRLILTGPPWCRAKRKRPPTKGMSAEHMASIRPKKEPS